MSKVIKVIDLLNKIANGEEKPKEFKYDGNTYTLRADDIYVDIKTNDYFSEAIYYDLGNMNEEVEIIEEEPEIDIQGIKEITSFGIKQNQDGINLLIRAVKQLDKQINNK